MGACERGDPLRVGQDRRVLLAMTMLGIPTDTVRFRGCSGLPFSAGPDSKQEGVPQSFVVNYPIEVGKDFLAPIVHELAHVTQMRLAGGLEPLRSKMTTSRRIELGADFLTGFVFSGVLHDADINEFQHNLSLIGLYQERLDQAHGTPAQRTMAFRRGVMRRSPYDELHVQSAILYFNDNDYAKVTGP